MCGRFALTMELSELQAAFPWIDFGSGYTPRYNIAPSQDILTFPNTMPGKAGWFRWGLIPPWAKDVKIGYQLINARGETVAEKPSFRNAFRNRRCLIPADGFYEWKKEGATKTPYCIRMTSARPFAFAGLWEQWGSDSETLFSCTIITTDANTVVNPIHHRMPVILSPSDYEAWLDPEFQDDKTLTRLLTPFQAEKMTAFPISKQINNPRNEGPGTVVPAPE
ncbi:SOS response-associated peptidase [bacterium]|nr:SOS response-associated peptidase [bacterium]